jgi:hypothetical protein
MTTAGIKQEQSSCPRCGKAFQCMATEIGNCDCYGLKLGEDASRYISEKYSECLCLQCLQEINQQEFSFRDQAAGGDTGEA